MVREGTAQSGAGARSGAMAEPHFAAQTGRRVSLPGHFEAPVLLEDVRPLGADGSADYECRARR